MTASVKRPTFSVLTPVYNGERFIERSYYCLRRQTFADWEWIVVDDGSTDRTATIVRRLSDRRTKLISYRDNRGRGYARSRSLEAASGEWLVIWDVDDIYFPDRLARANESRRSGYDFACSHAVLIDDGLEIRGMRGFTRADDGRTPMFMHPTLCCRAELLREIGYPDFRAGEDAGVILTLSQRHQGDWITDVLLASHYTADISCAKSLASNEARLASYRRLRERRLIDFGRLGYARMEVRLRFKIAVLRQLCRFPQLYWLTVPLRTTGDISRTRTLSRDRCEFLAAIRRREAVGDWSVAPRKEPGDHG